jgi:hypothetical protein
VGGANVFVYMFTVILSKWDKSGNWAASDRRSTWWRVGPTGSSWGMFWGTMWLSKIARSVALSRSNSYPHWISSPSCVGSMSLLLSLAGILLHGNQNSTTT